MARTIALISLIVVLGLVNWSIYKKEEQLANGRVVYLGLVPVDPRSLMQGDYMDLRFKVADDVYRVLPKAKSYKRWRHDVDASDGFVVVELDDNKVAAYKGLYAGDALSEDELLLRYRVRNGAVKFATDAFFFQEGNAKIYENAKYGQFRVDAAGELLLVAMYDKDLHKLEPKATN